jgi:hypothetical protein
MKKPLSLAAAAAAMAAAASTSSFAFTKADAVGERADGATAGRVVNLGSTTRHLNVDYGDVVRFVANGREFAWTFDGVGDKVKLSEIAPSDFNPPDVTVYVNQTLNPMHPSVGE